jgi:hypothetical protein
MIIQPLLCVSFPRSGACLLEESLRLTMGDAFVYCEWYKEPFDPARHNFLKNHDYKLDFEPPAGWQAILQLRNLLDAVPSWFDLEVSFGTLVDNYESWRAWAPKAFEHWRRLAARWRDRPDVRAIIWHDELTFDPRRAIAQVVEIMTGVRPTAVQHPPLRAPSSRHTWRFFCSEDFRQFAKSFDPPVYDASP